ARAVVGPPAIGAAGGGRARARGRGAHEAPGGSSRVVGGGPRDTRPRSHVRCGRPLPARRRARRWIGGVHRTSPHAPIARPSRDCVGGDRKSTRLNSSHEWISYAVFCVKKKKRY